MNGSELIDLFVGGQAATWEIAEMNVATVYEQVVEMRQDEPDDINMTSREIAEAILAYAREETHYQNLTEERMELLARMALVVGF